MYVNGILKKDDLMSFSVKNSGFARVVKTLGLLASITLLQACGADDATDSTARESSF